MWCYGISAYESKTKKTTSIFICSQFLEFVPGLHNLTCMKLDPHGHLVFSLIALVHVMCLHLIVSVAHV